MSAASIGRPSTPSHAVHVMLRCSMLNILGASVWRTAFGNRDGACMRLSMRLISIRDLPARSRQTSSDQIAGAGPAHCLPRSNWMTQKARATRPGHPSLGRRSTRRGRRCAVVEVVDWIPQRNLWPVWGENCPGLYREASRDAADWPAQARAIPIGRWSQWAGKVEGRGTRPRYPYEVGLVPYLPT